MLCAWCCCGLHVPDPYAPIFTRDAAERAAWARDLAWLRDNAKVFTSTGRAKPRRATARR
jgi:hypothetical protein